MKVRDLMTRDVVTLPPAATVEEAARLMESRNVGTVLVTEGNQLKGLLTDRRVVTDCIAKGRNPSATKVEEIMSPAGPELFGGLVTADPEMDALDAARLMGQHKVRRLPVVSDSQLLGIISVADLADDLRAYLGSILEEISKAEK